MARYLRFIPEDFKNIGAIGWLMILPREVEETPVPRCDRI